ncbi:MAG: HDOD domain-containing protein [Planctomycetota bacterium]
MQDFYVGRQPIYGRNLDVYAYELLFRSGDLDYADFAEGDRATSLVILNAFTEIGLDRVVGERMAFLNLTRGFIVGEYPLPVPHERVVLEVLEDVQPDAAVIRGLRRLKQAGYLIALDDYASTGHHRPLLSLADIVKVDCLSLDPDQIRVQVESLARYDAKLLAEKIETQEQFNACRELGFDYFQGFFLSRPNVIHERGVRTNRINLLRLLADLQDPGCDFDTVHEIVAQDVALSYKLLRHINSAAFGLPRRIESVRETLVYLGFRQVKNLASLFLMASVDDKPHDLVVTSMLRGKMCELMAVAHGRVDPHRAFTVGLFSVLDALMDCPMDSALRGLPFADELREALLERRGDLGEVLSSTLAYERGDWDRVLCLDLTRGQIKAAFLGAVEWVDAIDQELLSLAA